MAGNYSTQLKCLICATQISNFVKSVENSSVANKLFEKHLKIVFLLRNVLNISSGKLVQFLQGCPKVDDWISICDNCETLVNQCKELYHKYEKGKQDVFKILKQSCSTSCYDDGNDDKGILDIFKEVREDVNQRKLDCIKTIHKFGDLRADELAIKLVNLSQLNDEIFIKEESDEDDHLIYEDVTFEPLSAKWTDNDEDIEEDKPEVKDILEIEEAESSDEDDHKSNLKEKRKYIRNRPPFQCPFCKIYSVPILRSPAQVFKHLQTCGQEHKLSTTEITCSTCNQFKCSSDNIISFYHHVLACPIFERVPLRFRVFQCSLCPPSSSDNPREIFPLSKFLPHITHHKEFIYQCTQCNEPLKNSHDSHKHWRKHHTLEYQAIPEDQRSSPVCHVTVPPALPSVPWWCPQCSKEFSTEDLRDLHVSTNHPSISKDNACQLCDKRYHCPKELQLHQLICHSPEKVNEIGSLKIQKKFHKCSLCSEVFSGLTGKIDLLTHQSRTHKLSQFKCEICEKEFLSVSALKGHRTSHQFDLKCGECGKTYFSKKSFDRHVAVVHEKSRAFTCDLCGKNLADGNSLLHHQRDKHGLSEKKWRCEVEGCGKRLKDLHSLKAHMAKHANCPEFKCALCGQEFYTRGNLNRHNKTVHSKGLDEDFVCDECPFRTKFKYNLGVHKKSAHDSDKQDKAIKVKRRKINVK